MTRAQASNAIDAIRSDYARLNTQIGALYSRIANLEDQQDGQLGNQGDISNEGCVPSTRKAKPKVLAGPTIRGNLPNRFNGDKQPEGAIGHSKLKVFLVYAQPFAGIIALIISILTLWNTIETSKRSQRAYVTISQFIYDKPPFSESENKVITYVAKNSGQTPGMHYQISRLDGAMSGGRCGDGHSHPGVYQTDDIIGPADERRQTITVVPLSHGCVVDLDSGTATFTISGDLKYVDIYKTSHSTNFCWRYAPAPDRVFAPCTTGNDMN